MATNPNDLLGRIDLTKLYPKFVEKLRLLVANCAARGVDYYAYSGLRSWDEQLAIYAQGRGTSCPECKKTGAKCKHIITKAPPGWSAHNYGIAADLAKDKDAVKLGLQPDWKTEEYEILAEEAEKLGLSAGQHWTKFKDPPHVQLPLDKYGITWNKLISIYNNSKNIQAVWDFLDVFQW